MKSPFRFTPRGECGKMVSEIFPNLGRHVDKMAFIHSVFTESNNHSPALFMMNTGMPRMGFPCVGSWVTYGLGSESREPARLRRDERPARAGDCPRVTRRTGARRSCPASYQGTHLHPKGSPIDDLERPAGMTDDEQRAQLDLHGQRLNQLHRERFAAEAELAARIQSFELAYRMQSAAPEAIDIDARAASHIKKLYGIDDPRCDHVGAAVPDRPPPGRARRALRPDLLRRHGKPALLGRPHRHQGQPRAVRRRDRPAGRRPARRPRPARPARRDAGDLGRRVRPAARSPRPARSPAATTTRTDSRSGWPAAASKGASATARPTRSATRAAVDPVHINDLHATILHLLGIDHERLTYTYNGRRFRLTDVAGKVVKSVLA